MNMDISAMVLKALAEEHGFDLDAYAGEMFVDPILDEDELQISGSAAGVVEFLLLVGSIIGAKHGTDREALRAMTDGIRMSKMGPEREPEWVVVLPSLACEEE
jgi:hypothetical protein